MRAFPWRSWSKRGRCPGPAPSHGRGPPHGSATGRPAVVAAGPLSGAAGCWGGLRRACASAAFSARPRSLFGWLLLEALYHVWERPRPQEALAGAHVDGSDWSAFASDPSGHVVVTTAICPAGWIAVPALRVPLSLYAAAIAASRGFFGAHLPADVLASLLLGWGAARLTVSALARAGALRPPGASAGGAPGRRRTSRAGVLVGG